MQYVADNGRFVIVAANHGAPHPPAWCLNLRADRRATVHAGADRIDVEAREAVGQERTTLWRRLTAANRYLEGVARKARRELPIVVLTTRQRDST